MMHFVIQYLLRIKRICGNAPNRKNNMELRILITSLRGTTLMGVNGQYQNSKTRVNQIYIRKLFYYYTGNHKDLQKISSIRDNNKNNHNVNHIFPDRQVGIENTIN